LRGISVQGLSPGDTAAAEALLAHAQMLRGLLPATDSVLRTGLMFAGVNYLFNEHMYERTAGASLAQRADGTRA